MNVTHVREVPDTDGWQVGHHPTFGWVALRHGNLLPIRPKYQVIHAGRRRCMAVSGLMRLAGASITDLNPHWLDDEGPIPLDHHGLPYDVCDATDVPGVQPFLRTRAAGSLKPGSILTPTPHPKDGRAMHTLCRADGRRMVKQLAWVVLLATAGPAPTRRHVAAHNDGNPHNCQPRNLRWATPAENWQDSHQHGTAYMPWKDTEVA